MQKTLSFSDLLSRWNGIFPYEIARYIPDGLQPYTKNVLKWDSPTEYNQKYIDLIEKIDYAQKTKDDLEKIQNIVSGVVLHLDRAEEYATEIYLLKKNKVQRQIKGDEKRIGQNTTKSLNGECLAVNMNAVKPILEMLHSETEKLDGMIISFLNDSGINLDTLPSRSCLHPSPDSALEDLRIHKNNIRAIRYVYDNCDRPRIAAQKRLNEFRDKRDNTDWGDRHNFIPPKDRNLLDGFTENLRNMVFKIEDIEKIETKAYFPSTNKIDGKKRESLSDQKRDSESHSVFAANFKNNKSNTENLNDAILRVLKEVDILYEGLKKKLKSQNLKLSGASEKQQQDACRFFFNNNQKEFNNLELKHIQGAISNSQYWGTNNSARDIEGGLFEQFIIHEYSYLAADKNLKTNYQDLYILSRELKKTV